MRKQIICINGIFLIFIALCSNLFCEELSGTNSVLKFTGSKTSEKQAYKDAGSVFEGVVTLCEEDIDKMLPPRRYFLKVKIGENFKGAREGEVKLSIMVNDFVCDELNMPEKDAEVTPKAGDQLIFFTELGYKITSTDFSSSNFVFKLLPATADTRALMRNMRDSKEK